ncbi:hypothetical protein ACIGHG_17195 [Bacillus sp. NPDC077411]|uniref:Uncharacterized protein n=1 Tax=Bacillus bruguierae TaxID=3127667 RepID=A0ABU8FF66_9BACI
MALLLLSIILFALLLVIQGIRDRSIPFTLLACIPFLMVLTPILFLILGIPEESLPITISINAFWSIVIIIYSLLFVISVLKKNVVAITMSFIQICTTAFWFSVISVFWVSPTFGFIL